MADPRGRTGSQEPGEDSPTRVLYVFRHAKSSWDDPSLGDFDRPLARRGREASKVMARHMADAGVRPDLVLCSPSARTRQTLEAVLPAFDSDVDVRYVPEIYHGSAVGLLELLHDVGDEVGAVMIVGHNPGFHTLATALAGSGDDDARDRLRFKFPTAALATLALNVGGWADLAPASCELLDFVVPRELS